MGLRSDVMSFGPTRRGAAQNIAEVSTSSAPMLKPFRTLGEFFAMTAEPSC